MRIIPAHRICWRWQRKVNNDPDGERNKHDSDESKTEGRRVRAGGALATVALLRHPKCRRWPGDLRTFVPVWLPSIGTTGRRRDGLSARCHVPFQLGVGCVWPQSDNFPGCGLVLWQTKAMSCLFGFPGVRLSSAFARLTANGYWPGTQASGVILKGLRKLRQLLGATAVPQCDCSRLM